MPLVFNIAESTDAALCVGVAIVMSLWLRCLMTVAIVVLLPVPAKPVNKTGVFELMHSMIVSNAACCLVVSFMFQISQNKKAIFFNAW
jgi:cytochrome b561